MYAVIRLSSQSTEFTKSFNCRDSFSVLVFL